MPVVNLTLSGSASSVTTLDNLYNYSSTGSRFPSGPRAYGDLNLNYGDGSYSVFQTPGLLGLGSSSASGSNSRLTLQTAEFLTNSDPYAASQYGNNSYGTGGYGLFKTVQSLSLSSAAQASTALSLVAIIPLDQPRIYSGYTYGSGAYGSSVAPVITSLQTTAATSTSALSISAPWNVLTNTGAKTYSSNSYGNGQYENLITSAPLGLVSTSAFASTSLSIPGYPPDPPPADRRYLDFNYGDGSYGTSTGATTAALSGSVANSVTTLSLSALWTPLVSSGTKTYDSNSYGSGSYSTIVASVVLPLATTQATATANYVAPAFLVLQTIAGTYGNGTYGTADVDGATNTYSGTSQNVGAVGRSAGALSFTAPIYASYPAATTSGTVITPQNSIVGSSSAVCTTVFNIAINPSNMVADSVSVSDFAGRAISSARTKSDNITVSDAGSRTLSRLTSASDSVSLNDSAVRTVSLLGSPVPPNLVANPSFENDVAGSSPSNWNSFGDTAETLVVQASDATDGVNSLRVTSTAAFGTGANYVGVAQAVPVTSGLLKLSLGFRSYNVPRAVYYGVATYFYNSLSQSLASPPNQYFCAQEWSDGYWPQIAANGGTNTLAPIVAPAETAFAYLYIWVQNYTGVAQPAGISFAVDNVSLTKVAYEATLVGDSATGGTGGFRTQSDTAPVSDTSSASSSMSRTASDTVTSTDVGVVGGRIFNRLASEPTITVADLVTRVLFNSRTKSDTSIVTDSATKTSSSIRVTSDSVAQNDSVTRGRSSVRSLNDSISIADIVIKTSSVARTAPNSVTITDATTRNTARILIASDSVVGSDLATKKSSVICSGADSFSIADLVGETFGKLSYASDSASISDASAATGYGYFRFGADAVVMGDFRYLFGSATDSVSVSESNTYTKLSYRTANDSVGGGGGTNQTITAMGETYLGQTYLAGGSSDPPINDVAFRQLSLVRTLSDSVTVSDLAIRTHIRQTQIGTDTVSQSDAVSRIEGNSRIVTGANFSISDLATRNVGKPRTPIDTISVSDSIAWRVSGMRAASDALSISDLTIRITVDSRTVNDSISISESILLQRFRFADESLSITDTTTRDARVDIRNSTDTLTLSDINTRTGAGIRITSESVNLNDLATKIQGFVRSLSDDVTVSDLGYGIKVLVAFENLIVTDFVSKVNSVSRSNSESVSISDLVTRSWSNSRSVTESITVSDLSVRDNSRIRISSDSSSLSDSSSRTRAIVRALSDATTVYDASSRLQPSSRSINESLSVSDLSVRFWVSSRNSNDSVDISDLVTRSGLILRSGVDSVDISDLSIRFWVASRNSSDTLVITESLTAIYHPFGSPTYQIEIVTVPKYISFKKMVITDSERTTSVTPMGQHIHIDPNYSTIDVEQLASNLNVIATNRVPDYFVLVEQPAPILTVVATNEPVGL
jgi:hypothetical protein